MVDSFTHTRQLQRVDRNTDLLGGTVNEDDENDENDLLNQRKALVSSDQNLSDKALVTTILHEEAATAPQTHGKSSPTRIGEGKHISRNFTNTNVLTPIDEKPKDDIEEANNLSN